MQISWPPVKSSLNSVYIVILVEIYLHFKSFINIKMEDLILMHCSEDNDKLN